MTNAVKAIDHAEQQCIRNGTRLTTKRKAVLLALLKSNQALTAYELSDLYKEESGETMAPMSVYRILEFLESEQLVHKLNLANRFVACIHITCDHQHAVPQFLICTSCYRVSEISIKESTMKSLSKIVDTAGYTLVSPQIEMNCLCNECMQANQKTRQAR
ncbi:MAG: transcriptional repressor [Gammaproteobacteria bacterium]|nr:transcriptional repressor [Gammaproteobacteria bacterium]